MSAPSGFATLVADRHIIVCCGSGGVGKTTTAAALALEGARRGRNTVVVTIDPAKRLANALGLESLADTASAIDRALWDPDGVAPAEGRLSALMLDTKSTFDRLVARYSGGEEQARGIIENRFYRNVSSALSGTQEYMAMEKLHELHDEGGYDLIVVDTPPTRNALDFVDAPERLTRFLDHRLVRFLLFPTRATLRAASVAAQAFLRTMSRVVGTEAVQDAIAFFQAFEGMEQGFRDRAQKVLELLSDPGSAFVLVTSPRRDAVEEAMFFAARLAETDIPVQGMIVNRIHPSFGDEAPAGLAARADSLAARGDDAAMLSALYRNLADLSEVARLERDYANQLAATIAAKEGAPVPLAFVPYLSEDVHDFIGLTEIALHVFGDAPTPATASALPATGF
ncbi:MAG TPA: ArsA-related P-loop ATPase [Acidimicrobiia bacterium]|nr:ArsA-related P-loop ATPase [Acidimicrobiia bacterium]